MPLQRSPCAQGRVHPCVTTTHAHQMGSLSGLIPGAGSALDPLPAQPGSRSPTPSPATCRGAAKRRLPSAGGMRCPVPVGCSDRAASWERGAHRQHKPRRQEAGLRNHGVASLPTTVLQEQPHFLGRGSCSTSSRHPAPRCDKHVQPVVLTRNPLPAERKPGTPTARPPPPPPLSTGSSPPPLTPVRGPALCKAGVSVLQCSLSGQQLGKGQDSTTAP